MRQVLVRPALGSERLSALEILFARHEDGNERASDTLTAAEKGEIPLDHLLVAEERGNVVGAGLFTIQPGGVAFVWPPGAADGCSDQSETRQAILRDIARRLDEHGVALGQLILEPIDPILSAELEQTGFFRLTNLQYMLRPLDHSAEFRLTENATFESFQESNAARFADVLARTYSGTFDCPELEGLRTAEQALAGHRATGRFSPLHWRILRVRDTDAGLLLVNEHPESELFEIVYLGVVPEFRGRGLGRFLVESAVEEASGESKGLVLAVDERNRFARKIYQDAGLLDLSLQSLYVRPAGGRPLQS